VDFTFTEDQMALCASVREFLQHEVTPDYIRQCWERPAGGADELWQKMVELGLTAMLVPEAHGGLGLSEIDFVMIAEECGKVALPGPLVVTALVATPLLASLADQSSRCAEVLAALAAGEARVAVQHWINPFVNHADAADWLILPHGDEVHLLAKKDVTLSAHKSVDPSRRLFKVNWQPSRDSVVCSGTEGADLWHASLNRGALGAAAQLLGIAQTMVAMAVKYSGDRQQFGKPIGSFQAVKHLLANCAVKYEFARAPLYRAAYTTSANPTRADFAVSCAKAAAGEAALLAAKNSIQVHGAMGYTWECDLHIWMKRAWTLDKTWGDPGFHKNRVHEWLLNDRALIGAENTFGRLDILPSDSIKGVA
jgi:alkylation response protein AidB-like acyl-CoA dehydrogenase